MCQDITDVSICCFVQSNETTVCEFLDFMSVLGRGGSNTSNFTISLDDVLVAFDLNDSDITCNDSVPILLDALTEELFNVTFDDVLDFSELRTYSNCRNLTQNETQGFQ